MSAILEPKMTLEAFLAWENEQPDRHELHCGEIFPMEYAMVGARRAHGVVVGNLMRHFGNQLAGSPCRPFALDQKVQVAEDTVFYPDLFVTCDKADLATDLVFRAPTLVIEVLSPATAGYDLGQKFALYRRLDALREYILVDPDTRRVEGFRRGADDRWVLYDMSDGEVLEAASVGVSVRLADVFDGVDPAP